MRYNSGYKTNHFIRHRNWTSFKWVSLDAQSHFDLIFLVCPWGVMLAGSHGSWQLASCSVFQTWAKVHFNEVLVNPLIQGKSERSRFNQGQDLYFKCTEGSGFFMDYSWFLQWWSQTCKVFLQSFSFHHYGVGHKGKKEIYLSFP